VSAEAKSAEAEAEAAADETPDCSAMERKKLLGRKLGMTHVFDENGDWLPVTLLEVGPCYVVEVRDGKRDGYDAVQIGFGRRREKNTTKPMRILFRKRGVPPLRHLREVRLKGAEHDFKPGQVISAAIFEGAKFLDVTGTSKGRGFTGTIKRYGFRRGPESHGSQNVRRSGAIGACMTPGRVFKGKRMAGRHGGRRVTVKNLKVVEIRPEENLIAVRGAVPGPNGGLVEVRESVRG